MRQISSKLTKFRIVAKMEKGLFVSTLCKGTIGHVNFMDVRTLGEHRGTIDQYWVDKRYRHLKKYFTCEFQTYNWEGCGLVGSPAEKYYTKQTLENNLRFSFFTACVIYLTFPPLQFFIVEKGGLLRYWYRIIVPLWCLTFLFNSRVGKNTNKGFGQYYCNFSTWGRYSSKGHLKVRRFFYSVHRKWTPVNRIQSTVYTGLQP